jgi:hypothetical protein
MAEDDIKSALEIAMEKVERLGEATEEERLKWKYLPEGELLANKYLNAKDYNLVAELSQYPDKEKIYVLKGASEVLIRNIGLPKNDAAKKSNRRAMDGLRNLKNDKAGVENIYSRIRYLFNHYDEEGEQQRRQAYESLKAELEAKIREEMQKQLGPVMGMRIDVERQPQFQQEWRRVLTQLDSQYLNLMNEYKRELSDIA